MGSRGPFLGGGRSTYRLGGRPVENGAWGDAARAETCRRLRAHLDARRGADGQVLGRPVDEAWVGRALSASPSIARTTWGVLRRLGIETTVDLVAAGYAGLAAAGLRATVVLCLLWEAGWAPPGLGEPY